MEFDQLKQLWDSQNKQKAITMNTEALHITVLAKQHQAKKITHVTELLVLFVNIGSATMLTAMNLSHGIVKVYPFVLAAWMTLTAVYILYHRARRLKESRRFDRSLMGDLQHALSEATFQVRLSLLMRWNTIPIAILVFLIVDEGKGTPWLSFGILAFFAITFFASRWEHNLYKKKKTQLEDLVTKLKSN
jgi:hypothetical protein